MRCCSILLKPSLPPCGFGLYARVCMFIEHSRIWITIDTYSAAMLISEPVNWLDLSINYSNPSHQIFATLFLMFNIFMRVNQSSTSFVLSIWCSFPDKLVFVIHIFFCEHWSCCRCHHWLKWSRCSMCIPISVWILCERNGLELSFLRRILCTEENLISKEIEASIIDALQFSSKNVLTLSVLAESVTLARDTEHCCVPHQLDGVISCPCKMLSTKSMLASPWNVESLHKFSSAAREFP